MIKSHIWAYPTGHLKFDFAVVAWSTFSTHHRFFSAPQWVGVVVDVSNILGDAIIRHQSSCFLPVDPWITDESFPDHLVAEFFNVHELSTDFLICIVPPELKFSGGNVVDSAADATVAHRERFMLSIMNAQQRMKYSHTLLPFFTGQPFSAESLLGDLDAIVAHLDFRSKENASNLGKALALCGLLERARDAKRHMLVLTSTPGTVPMIAAAFRRTWVFWREVHPPFEATSEAFLVCECSPDTLLDWRPLAVDYAVAFSANLHPIACFRPTNNSPWDHQVKVLRLVTIQTHELAAAVQSALVHPAPDELLSAATRFFLWLVPDIIRVYKNTFESGDLPTPLDSPLATSEDPTCLPPSGATWPEWEMPIIEQVFQAVSTIC